MRIDDLKAGMILTNQEIADIFLCSTQGGMRRSKRTNTLVLISDCTKLYHDQWHGSILHYTGMGQKGDQSFDFMQNRTLYESKTNGVQIHLFEVLHSRCYTYCGMVELADSPYCSEQEDQLGNMRTVCMFPLQKIDG